MIITIDTDNVQAESTQITTNHEERPHALLSASSSNRWVNCPRSVRLAEDESYDNSMEAAREGTAAHELAEWKVKSRIIPNFAETKPFDAVYQNREMERATDAYADFVVNAIKKAGPGRLFLEERISLEAFVPEGFGTADAVYIPDNGDALMVIDFKYGRVRVDPKMNYQLMLYGGGFFQKLAEEGETDLLGKLLHVELYIFQPRDKMRPKVWRTTAGELYKWLTNTCSAAAEDAWKGDGKLTAGPWCRYCPLVAKCRKSAIILAEFLKKDPEEVPTLDEEESHWLLLQADHVENVIAAIRADAETKAAAGKVYPGMEMRQTKARRLIKKEDREGAVQALLSYGEKNPEVKFANLVEVVPRPIGQLVDIMGSMEAVEDVIGGYLSKSKTSAKLQHIEPWKETDQET